ncbi:MAG: VOC family protein [Bdellovibrionaceae bacterium]|nr:VOC family protein [Pseudobdellovibrionaceae bacterium]
MKLGYTILYVGDVKATMNFYENAFSLKPKFLHESGQYGEMDTGETTLSFTEHNSSKPKSIDFLKTTDAKSSYPVEIAFTTKDVSTAYKKAMGAGCKNVSEPEQKPWGQVVSYVLDLNGFLVEICSPIS